MQLNLDQQRLRQARDNVKAYDSALVDYVTKPDENFACQWQQHIWRQCG